MPRPEDDLAPGTEVTRIVFSSSGQETRYGTVVRKLKTRYLVRWRFPGGFEAETPHKRIEGSRAFY